uniref:Uncharacterized protein n=1 Tax=Leersia perrieri TaxID=77586 RepID=A0A0D9UXB7_9ORYZ
MAIVAGALLSPGGRADSPLLPCADSSSSSRYAHGNRARAALLRTPEQPPLAYLLRLAPLLLTGAATSRSLTAGGYRWFLAAAASEGTAQWLISPSPYWVLGFGRPVQFRHPTVVKVATSVATVVPVVLSVLPFFHQVYTGSFDRTIELYGAPAMAGGLLNSIIWLMYAIVTSKKELSIGLLLTHAFLCMATFAYLMSICAHKRATKQGYALGAFFIVCLSIISTVPHWDINPSEFVKDCFGYLGLFLLATCHLIQICGILDGLTKRSQKIATVVDVLPSCLMNMVTSIITAQAHPKQQLILASSIIGFAFTFIEIILVIIGPILGYVFPLAHNRIVDPEALTQHDHPSDTLNLNSSTQDAEPNPMLLRDLGIKYLLRDLEIQYWVARGRLEALQQSGAVAQTRQCRDKTADERAESQSQVESGVPEDQRVTCHLVFY